MTTRWRRSWRGGAAWLGFVACLVLAMVSPAWPGETLPRFGFFPHDEPADPVRFASPNGEWVLDVEPVAISLPCAASCRLHRCGELVWEQSLPFSFQIAQVTDTGIVCGFGESESAMDPERIAFVILGPNGETRANWREAYSRDRAVDPPHRPRSIGIYVEPEFDRVTLRIPDLQQRPVQSWFTFRLSDGARLPDVGPTPSETAQWDGPPWLLSARGIPGTPLRLLHWKLESYRPRRSGARFEVIDAAAISLWSLDLPDDYTPPNAEEADREARALRGDSVMLGRIDGPSLSEIVEREDPVLELRADSGSGGGRFALGLAKDGQRAEFVAQPDQATAGGWRIFETARSVWAVPSAESATSPSERSFPTIDLPELETIPLAVGPLVSNWPQRIAAWDFASDGRIVTFDAADASRWPQSWVVRSIDRTGSVTSIRRIAPTSSSRERVERWTRISDDEWWIAVSSEDERSTTFERWDLRRAERVPGSEKAVRRWDAPRNFPSVDGAAVSETPLSKAPAVRALENTRDGGFVALLECQRNRLRWLELLIQRPGRSEFQIVFDSTRDPAGLREPVAIAELPDGDLAVLESDANAIAILDPMGHRRRTIDLAAVCGTTPSNLVNLIARPDGALWVAHLDRESPFFVLSSAGELQATIVPQIPGRRFPLPAIAEARFAPDGTLWTSIDESFASISLDGEVKVLPRETVESGRLSKIGDADVLANGGLVALDPGSDAIHVFGAEGRRRFVTRLDEHEHVDFDAELILRADEFGGFRVAVRDAPLARTTRIAWFDGEGVRTDSSESREWQLARVDPSAWRGERFSVLLDRRAGASPHALQLVDRTGASVREYARRSDRRWIEYPSDAVVDFDGSLIAVDRRALLFLGRSDDAPRAVAIPENSRGPRQLSLCRDWILVEDSDWSGVTLIRRSDHRVFAWDPRTVPSISHLCARIVADRREVVVFDPDLIVLRRYALPSP